MEGISGLQPGTAAGAGAYVSDVGVVHGDIHYQTVMYGSTRTHSEGGSMRDLPCKNWLIGLRNYVLKMAVSLRR
jgi:hypothetical protein